MWVFWQVANISVPLFLVYKMEMVIIVSIPEPPNLPSLLFVLS